MGRRVREVWVRWAEKQPNPKPSWLLNYDAITPAEQDADDCIGMAIWAECFDKFQSEIAELELTKQRLAAAEARSYERIAEIDEIREQLANAREGDNWVLMARESIANGNCPWCFCMDEGPHQPGCYVNEIEAENSRLHRELCEMSEPRLKLHATIQQLAERLAEAEAELNECRSDLSSTVADWKDAHDGKMIAETAAFFLLEVCKHTDEVRYEQALKHWPFLEEAKGGRDE